MIDDIKKPMVVATKKLPPQAQEPETPSCWWKSVGVGADQAWVWHRETLCCCAEMGWLVDGRRLLPANPDQGSTIDGAAAAQGPQSQGDAPPAQVWARLGLTVMASPASIETSRASLRRPATPDSQGTRTPPRSTRSPIEPRVLSSPGSDRSTEDADSHDGGGSE